jgi:hypothetical protein
MLRAIDRENLVLLSPDVARYFPDEQSVNTALRAFLQEAKGRLRGAPSTRGERKIQSQKLHPLK